VVPNAVANLIGMYLTSFRPLFPTNLVARTNVDFVSPPPPSTPVDFRIATRSVSPGMSSEASGGGGGAPITPSGIFTYALSGPMMAVILETGGIVETTAAVVVVVDDDDGERRRHESSDDMALSLPLSIAAAYSGSLWRVSSRRDGDDGAIGMF
jgi:hypothetical protein